MTKVLVGNKKYDFTELNLKESLVIEEKVISCVAMISNGGQIPPNTLFEIGEAVLQFAEVDNVPIDDISKYYAGKEMRAEFHAAVMEGLKLNFSDLFIQLIDMYAPEAAKEKAAGALAAFGLATAAPTKQ